MTMSDLHEVLDRQAAVYAPPSDLLERVRARGRQRQRNRRVTTGLAGVVVLAGLIAGAGDVLNRPDALLVTPPPPAVGGSWVSTDIDGSSQTMDIRALEEGGYEVEILDDSAGVCAGATSTMTGTATLRDQSLVIAAPVFTCDDGSEPETTDGASLDELLRDYTLTYSEATDTLTDNFSVQWRRPGAVPEPPDGAVAPDGMWPQTTMEEVRNAQELADAGHPDYAWQVAPGLYDEMRSGPKFGDAPIFTRYLREQLGWAGFRWGDAVALTWDTECAEGPGCTTHQIGFARCATDRPNPLYPEHGQRGETPAHFDGTTCAPTIDDITYETAVVTVTQPLLKGPDGIWVVTGSRPDRALRQRVPLAEGDVEAVVEAFLQARLDGKGADAYLLPDQLEVPLLYATSNGSAYEEFDFQLHGPEWPSGTFGLTTRLYAQGRDRVVEQRFVVERRGDEPVLAYSRYASEENGEPVPVPHSAFDGRITYDAPPAWRQFFFDVGQGATGLYRDEGLAQSANFVLVGDPVALTGPCAGENRPASADALVRSVQANENLSASAPVQVRVASFDAVRMDVAAAEGAATCGGTWLGEDVTAVLTPQPGNGKVQPLGVDAGERMRLYLLDVPGRPATLAVMVIASKDVFKEVVKDAQPIVDSVAVHD